MTSTAFFRPVRFVVTAAALVCALSAADARTPFADVESTAWTTNGKVIDRVIARGRGFPLGKSDSGARLVFGPGEDLLADEFRLAAPDGMVVTGSYTLNRKGKAKLRVDRAASDDGLATSVEALLPPPFSRLRIKGVKVKAKPRQDPAGDTVKVKLVLRATFRAGIPGQTRGLGFRRTFKGVGTREP